MKIKLSVSKRVRELSAIPEKGNGYRQITVTGPGVTELVIKGENPMLFQGKSTGGKEVSFVQADTHAIWPKHQLMFGVGSSNFDEMWEYCVRTGRSIELEGEYSPLQTEEELLEGEVEAF